MSLWVHTILDYSDGLGITGASLGLGFRGRQMGDGSVMNYQYPGMRVEEEHWIQAEVWGDLVPAGERADCIPV